MKMNCFNFLCFLAVWSLVHVVAGGRSVSHQCIHDSDDTARHVYYHGFDWSHPADYERENERSTAQHRNFRTLSLGNIRIGVSLGDLYNSSRYCTAVGQVIQDFSGGTVTCASADDIFTDAKRDLLINAVLPRAIQMHADRLQINRMTSNLVVQYPCNYFTTPITHRSDGVPDVDMIIYVAAAKVTSDFVIAWAGACQLDQQNRPTVGKANFAPRFLTNQTDAELDSIIRVGVHELGHALGFSYPFFTNYFPLVNGSSGVVNTTIRGKPTMAVTFPAAVTAARAFFQCNELSFVELEDQGGPGTQLSHWERRNHYQDLMSGVAGDCRYSNITLGLFESSGNYFPNYALAESVEFAANATCDFLTTKCLASNAGDWSSRYFCNDTSMKTQFCTFDNRAVGLCYQEQFTAALPTYFQYFPGQPARGGSVDLVDYCPMVLGYSNRQCNDAASANASALSGSYYGSRGRCVLSRNLVVKGYTTTSTATCLQVRCPGGQRVEIKVGASEWLPCPLGGGPGTIAPPAAFGGSIMCPAAINICDPELFVPDPKASKTLKNVAASRTKATRSTASLSTISAAETTRSASVGMYSLSTAGSVSAASLSVSTTVTVSTTFSPLYTQTQMIHLRPRKRNATATNAFGSNTATLALTLSRGVTPMPTRTEAVAVESYTLGVLSASTVQRPTLIALALPAGLSWRNLPVRTTMPIISSNGSWTSSSRKFLATSVSLPLLSFSSAGTLHHPSGYLSKLVGASAASCFQLSNITSYFGSANATRAAMGNSVKLPPFVVCVLPPVAGVYLDVDEVVKVTIDPLYVDVSASGNGTLLPLSPASIFQATIVVQGEAPKGFVYAGRFLSAVVIAANSVALLLAGAPPMPLQSLAAVRESPCVSARLSDEMRWLSFALSPFAQYDEQYRVLWNGLSSSATFVLQLLAVWAVYLKSGSSDLAHACQMVYFPLLSYAVGSLFHAGVTIYSVRLVDRQSGSASSTEQFDMGIGVIGFAYAVASLVFMGIAMFRLKARSKYTQYPEGSRLFDVRRTIFAPHGYWGPASTRRMFIGILSQCGEETNIIFIVLPLATNACLGVLAGILPTKADSCGPIMFSMGGAFCLQCLVILVRRPCRSFAGNITFFLSYAVVGIVAVAEGYRWTSNSRSLDDGVSSLCIVFLLTHALFCAQHVIMMVYERGTFTTYREDAGDIPTAKLPDDFAVEMSPAPWLSSANSAKKTTLMGAEDSSNGLGDMMMPLCDNGDDIFSVGLPSGIDAPTGDVFGDDDPFRVDIPQVTLPVVNPMVELKGPLQNNAKGSGGRESSSSSSSTMSMDDVEL